MTDASASAPVVQADPLPRAPVAYGALTAMFALAALGLHDLLSSRIESRGLARLGAALACACGAGCLASPWLALRARRALLALAPLVGAAFAIGVAAAFAPDAWDECAYLLGGRALLGEPVPYPHHRPPVTALLAAASAAAPRLLNPILLVLVAALVGTWTSRRHGRTAAALVLLGLLAQDAFVESCLDLMSELPAAALILGAHVALARGSHRSCGLLLGVLTLTRWQLASVAAVMVVMAIVRLGPRAGAQLCAWAAAPVVAWLALSPADVLLRVYEGNFLPAYAWAAEGAETPTLRSRAKFYLPTVFFLTPLGAFSVLRVLTSPTADGSDESWTVRRVAPVAILVYLVSLLLVGGHFVRFAAPLLPLVALVTVEFLDDWRRRARLTDDATARLATVALLLVVSCGLRGTSLLTLQRNLRHTRAFSPGFVDLVSSRSGPVLRAPSIQPLTVCGGFPAMLELGRTIEFPAAARGPTGELRDSPPAQAVAALLAVARPGDQLLLPDGPLPTVGGQELARSGGWLVWVVGPE